MACNSIQMNRNQVQLQVAARVKESMQEITALNSLLNSMKEAEVKQAAKHKELLEKTRKLAQERVATAQAAVAAAEKAKHELQEKAAMQLNDANNKVHQAEAKLLAVRYQKLACVHVVGTGFKRGWHHLNSFQMSIS